MKIHGIWSISTSRIGLYWWYFRSSNTNQQEADAILNRLEENVDSPKPKTMFEPGEVVRVTESHLPTSRALSKKWITKKWQKFPYLYLVAQRRSNWNLVKSKRTKPNEISKNHLRVVF